jgi:hypothetical protein
MIQRIDMRFLSSGGKTCFQMVPLPVGGETAGAQAPRKSRAAGFAVSSTHG